MAALVAFPYQEVAAPTLELMLMMQQRGSDRGAKGDLKGNLCKILKWNIRP